MPKLALKKELINELLEIDDSYKAPEKLLEIMLDNQRRTTLFEEFLNIENDLSYEWFHNYFESEHADRKNKKQDFTPKSISKLGTLLLGKSDRYFEAAAGTGGMAIQFWNNNHSAFFELEELSDRAIPFLLFNMSIRGINGHITHGDSLSGEIKGTYILISNGHFSQIK